MANFLSIRIKLKITGVVHGKAQYIKNRAFNDAYYAKMILDFLDEYGEASRSEVDELIYDKLPEILDDTQKKNKIGNILGKLRRKGVIVNQGSAKTPKWLRSG